VGFNTYVDTPRCDAYRAGGGTAAEITAVCRPTLRRSSNGGNPSLKPETSESYFVGFVWEPLDTFSPGLDYWKIDHVGTSASR
jgi:iron complex outermembrane receptor protein